jgi:hypothetical protein
MITPGLNSLPSGRFSPLTQVPSWSATTPFS